MNEKFYQLPLEKQNRILNAGYRVFSENTYKKSPMQEVADEAGISKSLLFHYFRNKKEFYLYLWENACKYSLATLTAAGCYEKTDFFEMLYNGMQAKLEIIRKYPEMGNFIIKAYYEKDPEVCEEIQISYQKYFQLKAEKSLRNLPREQFLHGISAEDIFRHMFWAADGYLLDNIRNGKLDPEIMEKDFSSMIRFWRFVYGREKGHTNG